MKKKPSSHPWQKSPTLLAQFYSVVSLNSKVHYSASSLFFLIIIMSGRPVEVDWSVCISKSQKSFSRTDSGLCIYYLFACSSFNFLHFYQWITMPTQSCLLLYSFCANVQFVWGFFWWWGAVSNNTSQGLYTRPRMKEGCYFMHSLYLCFLVISFGWYFQSYCLYSIKEKCSSAKCSSAKCRVFFFLYFILAWAASLICWSMPSLIISRDSTSTGLMLLTRCHNFSIFPGLCFKLFYYTLWLICYYLLTMTNQ